MRRRFSTIVTVSCMLVALPAIMSEAAAPAPSCHGLPATIIGTAGDDVLNGTSGDDVIAGRGGNDRIDGRGGDDVICGGGGHDRIDGGAGFDWIAGNNGKDYLRGGRNADTIKGQAGRDAIAGGPGHDTMRGGSGRDVLGGGKASDEMFGGAGPDLFLGGGGSDTAHGGAGVDWCGAETISTCEQLPYARELHPDGLGAQTFGENTEAVLLEFAADLGDPMDMGDPDEDSGWIDSFSPFGTCPGTEVRVVRWGNVQIFNTRDSMGEDGEFFTVEVADPSGDREDKRAHTDEGLQWNDTRGQLQVIYGGRATIEQADPFDFWLFYIDANPSGIRGTLEGTGRYYDDVAVLGAGIGCGE